MKSEQAKQALEVSVVSDAQEKAWFDQRLADHHYLGAGKSVGDYMRQVVRREGDVVGLLVWGPACYALKDRDLWLGWSADRRIERLKLIVQNRRFLILKAKGQEPNLASQVMGAALRALPHQWQERFGYKPLLAESFTDPESYVGTCYKASNWKAVGASAGYSRHRADFYIPNERPKKLWLKELCPEAKRKLVGVELDADCRGGCGAAPTGVLPVSQAAFLSLREAFTRAPDPRSKNTRYRTGTVLSLVAMALLSGRREIAEIARFATRLSHPQRRLLGLPRKKTTKAFYQVPGYSVFYQVLNRMDPESFAQTLTGWLQQEAGTLPAALAMDGKMIREHIGLFSLVQHEDGSPQAIAVYDQKKGTQRCEQTAACQLLDSIERLDNKIITADPLHAQKKTARKIVEKGGDYLFQIKENQPGLLRQAKQLDALKGTPFLNMSRRGVAKSKTAP
jgi:hypothetical protein